MRYTFVTRKADWLKTNSSHSCVAFCPLPWGEVAQRPSPCVVAFILDILTSRTDRKHSLFFINYQLVGFCLSSTNRLGHQTKCLCPSCLFGNRQFLLLSFLMLYSPPSVPRMLEYLSPPLELLNNNQMFPNFKYKHIIWYKSQCTDYF